MLAYSAKVVSVVLRQFVNFAAMLWWEQVKFRWDDGEVRFVIDQYTYLNFDSASSLKQQYADRHVTPLRHIILISIQPVFALSR
jgi:hypothetical protein